MMSVSDEVSAQKSRHVTSAAFALSMQLGSDQLLKQQAGRRFST
jgi:hypothetical protein